MDRINEVTKDALDGIIQIRQLDATARPQPELLHQRMRTFIERAMRRATELGYSAQDAQDIGYALAALIDETALARPGDLRDYWQRRTLQLAFFNENVAGENFFQRMQLLIGEPARVDVLRAYYTCLLLGFQGKYRVRGGEIELSALTEQVASSLRVANTSSLLAPSGARPADQRSGVRRALPLIGGSIVAMVASLLLYTTLRITLSSSAEELAGRIASIVSG